MNTNIAAMIDHTILKADATEEQVRQICKEAIEYKFASVCVNSCYIPLVAGMLKGSGVKVCSVVGFPLGAMSSAAKAAETMDVVKNGADEVDMVINVGALKAKNYEYVKNDIEAVVAAKGSTIVKVIIETCLLTDEEKIEACKLAVAAGADFVKTSTGFNKSGANAEDIRLMRKTVGPAIGVKASGGIRDYETAVKMLKAGASRIGASASVSMVGGR